ncbi:transglycosylase protein with SLT domain [Stackebrandtia endophytica]|uniref:Transglycosylase protein with SLT domain n=1 Tax=Stackebrandtia endophytica TaxID=1496996 RepID=A0A543AYX5_9ACTN|nr:lytic murein transglycosylase [Stackebrandtia endophytica]TQL77773.1 transglycosylase protein with SLT domain [Stackebrandtia endophytica]
MAAWTTIPKRVKTGVGRALKTVRRLLRQMWTTIRRPGGRIVTQAMLTVGVIAGLIGLAVYAVPHSGPDWAYGEEVSQTTTEPADSPLALPPGLDAVPGAPGIPGPSQDQLTDTNTGEDELLRAWADSLDHLGIPTRALQAYGNAEMVLAQSRPNCNLAWTTLAGIGSVETNHGTTGGTSLDADGKPVKPIRGPALDGTNNNALIRDTDGGTLDGDTEFDRAVGPMQFIPETWERWGADGDGDGISDPNDIDDAAVAAGHYLCADNRDLSRATDWYTAVFSYNHLDSYVRDVYERADDYGKRSKVTS